MQGAPFFLEVPLVTSIRTLVIPPLCEPRELRFDAAAYENIQAIIGGSFDASQISDRVSLYFHDEGLLVGLQPNIISPTGAFVAGTILAIAIDDNGESADLTDEDVVQVRSFIESCERPGRVEYTIPPMIVATSQAELDAQLASRAPVRILGIDGPK